MSANRTHSPPIARPSSLGDDVYQAILGKLLRLDIAPGSRIAVDTLVRELNVSQTPIRHALARLESEGLVRKAHLVGYSAAPQLNREQFDQLFSLRLLIEPHLAGLAASRITGDDLAVIERLTSEMVQYRPGDVHVDYGLFAQKDSEFHTKIASVSGHQLAEDTLGRLHVHLHLFRLLFHSRVTSEAIDEHAAIVAALRSRDAQAAERAMKNHLEQSRKRFAPAAR